MRKPYCFSIVFGWFLLSLNTVNVQSRDFQTESVTMNNGFSAASLQYLVQDKYDFLWPRTTNGFYRIESATYFHLYAGSLENSSIQLYIRLLTQWWNTIAFRVLLIFILASLIVIIYWWRLNRLQKQKMVLEEEVQHRTNELQQSNKELLKKQEKLSEAYHMLEENQHEILTQKEELENHRNHLETLVKERTAELESALRSAEEADKLKSTFLANLSHEIRTPMNAIVGFSSLLETPNLSDEEKHKYISMVTNNCESLTILIDDIIDISLIESNQLRIVKKPFNADKILNELLEYYRSINNKDLEIFLERPKDRSEELILDNDPGRFKQVISKLLSNAFKYTDKGSIRFGYSVQGNDVQFYVSDTGIGIKEEDQETIFNQFHTVNISNQKLYRGVGLGLTISKNLVQIMGGKIGLDSVPEKGSTFFITLPMKREERKHIRDVSGESLDLTGYTILIAEDDDTNYLFIEKLMRTTHAKVIRARDGVEATEMVPGIRNREKLIILMDIKMPRMNGFEALRKIRQRYKDIPVIAVTAYAQEKDRMEILKNNFNGYITKPIMRSYLMRIISEQINK